MKVLLAQINPTVGDVAGNVEKCLDALKEGKRAGVSLVVLPELVVPGYPPKDLLEKPRFIEANVKAAEKLAAATKPGGTPALIFGFPSYSRKETGKKLQNSIALAFKGRMETRAKMLLPEYDVFDEERYFEPDDRNLPVRWNGRKIGLTVCEDIWNDKQFWREKLYERDPVEELVKEGAELIVNISASPFNRGKGELRENMVRHTAMHFRKPLLFVNQVGGNDDLVFDGHSLAVNADGEVLARCAPFREDLLVVDLDGAPFPQPDPRSVEEDLTDALVLGLRDYALKCGFKEAFLGLSGGIDSAVVAVIARKALGAENVYAISLPSKYSSKGSVSDAKELAERLGIHFDIVSIEAAHEVVGESLEAGFGEGPSGITDENIQARLRGLILMAYSNRYCRLLLSTGNKSEFAVGYCTLYGDMNGGLAVLSDVYKTEVYEIARFLNREKEIIPETILKKPPSAELKPDQLDQDTLPPYQTLDGIIASYIEDSLEISEIVKRGFPREIVEKVVRMVDTNEYKRKQAPPGIRLTAKAFGQGRRIPIAQRWTSQVFR